MGLRFTLLLLACVACSAQQVSRSPSHADPAEIDVGRAMFRLYCGPCHGRNAEGGRGPNLSAGNYLAGDRDEDLYQVIAEGVPGTEMAAYEGRLKEDSIWRIIAYLRSVSGRNETPPSGDAAAGGKIFWGKGACGSCHRIGARGGRLGPELSAVGRARSAAYLRESIVSPDEDITRGYSTISVIARDGRKITGIEKGYDTFSAQLIDAQENYHSFWREEVRSIQREERSLMPAYGDSLSAREIDDLLAYLANLRGKETRK